MESLEHRLLAMQMKLTLGQIAVAESQTGSIYAGLCAVSTPPNTWSSLCQLIKF